MSEYPDWLDVFPGDWQERVLAAGLPAREHTLYCRAAGCSFTPDSIKRMVGADLKEPSPRFAVHGTDLCNWHHSQFPRVLADLVNLHPDLIRAAYTKSSRDDNAGVRGSGMPADVGTSWNPHAAAVLAELSDWTGYLVRLLIREYPGPIGITEDDDVRVQLRTITNWYSPWLSRYPFVGPFLLADALQHRRAGMRALNSEAVKRVTLKNAVCQELLEEDSLGPIICGAPLFAILRPKDARPSEILCSTNPRHPQLPRDAWIDAMPRQA